MAFDRAGAVGRDDSDGVAGGEKRGDKFVKERAGDAVVVGDEKIHGCGGNHEIHERHEKGKPERHPGFSDVGASSPPQGLRNGKDANQEDGARTRARCACCFLGIKKPRRLGRRSLRGIAG